MKIKKLRLKQTVKDRIMITLYWFGLLALTVIIYKIYLRV